MRELLRPGADPAEMAGVADRDGAEPKLTRALSRKLHCLARNHLAVAEPTVDDEQRGGVLDNGSVAIREQLAVSYPIHVFCRSDQAVQVVSC